MAKAAVWGHTDAEARRRGEQTGLDTLVVHAVNDELKLKGIDGGPHKRWSMWFNSMQRAEPYLALTSGECPEMGSAARNPETGAAWLSSARVVRCWVKSRNECMAVVSSCREMLG